MGAPASPRRTQEEILARLDAVREDDMFGFRREVLLPALEFEHARSFLKPETTAEDWSGVQVCAGDWESAARSYYEFALGKIRDHRGISASRSVEKLTEYAWLLGRDDVIAAMDAAEYPQYGAPKVAAFAAAMGLDWPDGEALERMANGLPCTDDCHEGCGQ
ncbi:hypothetical protein GCM10023196_036100 [Actinoallomurus vinaceus]|uniref:DUF4240 domain-containing protein n=1 Tax=Actinoallomurus vinaceus TaxID=1080074 RepID=A0ABP8U8Z8_9ACTN